MHKSTLDKYIELSKNNQPFALAQIVRRVNPSSGKPGDKAIITKSGDIHGWIGGGCTRGIVLKESMLAISERKPRLVSIKPNASEKLDNYTKSYTMTCQSGGEVDVYIEPVLPKPNITVFGNSHIARALALLSSTMGNNTNMVLSNTNDRPTQDLGTIHDLAKYKPDISIADHYIIVCTQGEGDTKALDLAMQSGAKYTAFVASRLKAASIFGDLRQQGYKSSAFTNIKTPAGIDINAKTPEEVAISILAEIIADYRSEKSAAADEPAAVLNDDYYMNPVCNIPVQKSTAKHVVKYKKENVYFCCDGCKVSFEKNPKMYMEA